jgi:hypothetical protein
VPITPAPTSAAPVTVSASSEATPGGV